MIEVRGLTFDYPGVRALDDLTFTIERGSVVALVGPNGAGKSTLMRCLAALDQPVAGVIRLDGEEILADPRPAHRKIGYLPDFFGLYDALSVEQCLRFHAAAHGIEGGAQAKAVRLAAERLGLSDRLQQLARELSRGLRQRLAIAQAIVHEPPFLLLDEPASGLDPEARHSLSELFLQLRAEGMTLLVSSHILSELQAYSTHMLLLRGGRIVASEAIVGAVDAGRRMRLQLAAPFAELAALLDGVVAVSSLRVEGQRAEFVLAGDEAVAQQLLARLVQAGAPVCAFGPGERDMQGAYLERVRGAQ